jgi:hypothetical protein
MELDKSKEYYVELAQKAVNKSKEYYEKLYSFSREYNNQYHIESSNFDFVHCFTNMIYDNQDHILTDSFLNYLASRNRIDMVLRDLTSDYYKSRDKESIEFRCVSILTNYYFDTIDNILKDKKTTYFKLMDDETKAAIFDAIVYINKLDELVEYTNYNLFRRIVFYSLAYCHYNSNILDFKETFKKTLDNQNYILDDIKFHLLPEEKYPEYSGTALESFLRVFRNRDSDKQIN